MEESNLELQSKLATDYGEMDTLLTERRERLLTTRFVNQVTNSFIETLFSDPRQWEEYNTMLNRISMCFPADVTGGICKEPWTIETYVSKGKFGHVWLACCGKNCDYVLKYVCFKDCDNEFKPMMNTELINEIALQKCAAEKDLAPNIIEEWICDNDKGALYIAEAMEMTIEDLLIMYQDPKIWQNIFQHVFQLIKRLHDIGIIHRDAHFENIMVKAQKTGKNYWEQDYKYKFIDFGIACVVNDSVCPGVQSIAGCNPAHDYAMIAHALGTIVFVLNSIHKGIPMEHPYSEIPVENIPPLLLQVEVALHHARQLSY